jgi:hypothetical protein
MFLSASPTNACPRTPSTSTTNNDVCQGQAGTADPGAWGRPPPPSPSRSTDLKKPRPRGQQDAEQGCVCDWMGRPRPSQVGPRQCSPLLDGQRHVHEPVRLDTHVLLPAYPLSPLQPTAAVIVIRHPKSEGWGGGTAKEGMRCRLTAEGAQTEEPVHPSAAIRAGTAGGAPRKQASCANEPPQAAETEAGCPPRRTGLPGRPAHGQLFA